MTTVPAYLSQVIDEEILRIKKDVLRKVSEIYELPLDELERRVLYGGAVGIVETTPSIIRIVRPKVKKQEVAEEDRCLARTWSRGEGGQCQRRKSENGLCVQHARQFANEGKLKHGWIHERPPKDTFTIKRPTALYK